MILSFHPCIEADAQIILADTPINDSHMRLIEQADAIILPQTCTFELYSLCRTKCSNVFPNYDMRFRYPGKVGQSSMFEKLGLPHPHTRRWKNTKEFWDFLKETDSFPHGTPFVVKANLVHEGAGTFIVENHKELSKALDFIQKLEDSGQVSFITQEFIPNDGHVLRVVIIGDRLVGYWKIGHSNQVVNISTGAQTDNHSRHDLLHEGTQWAKILRQRTNMDLAAIDLIFPLYRYETPMFLEVNYYFGRRGLGGSTGFYEMLFQAAKQWVKDLGLNEKSLKLI